MDGGVGRVLDAAVDEGFLTTGAAAGGFRHSSGFLAGTPLPAADRSAVDLGSGGGLPGLVLATRTDCNWFLVDRSERRCRFLEWAVRTLELSDRVSVVQADATEVGWGELRGSVTLVTARGFGPPGATAECGAPLLVEGGHLVVSEPPGGGPSRWPVGPLGELGLSDAGAWESEGAGFRAFQAFRARGDRFPRAWKAIERSPLF
ncbi:MAG: class I SAM-dependent methyltransferase [Acidimicrobiales bacterium]|nr:class I SAM-dependent methyltransferase [Acidimicrobiales bacterium]